MRITPTLIQEYRKYLIKEEKSSATIEKYLRDISRFYTSLPLGKQVDQEAVLRFKEGLMNGYKPASVNSMLAAVNSFLIYLGKPEWRVHLLKIQKQMFYPEERELTKKEYQRLVQAAREQKKRRLQLILQTVCSTGIRISELSYITAEALAAGSARVNCKNKIRLIWIPKKLVSLLSVYCRKQGIISGPVFITRSGRAVCRSSIWSDMKGLCRTAGVDPCKVFPHNLRHLFARSFYEQEKDIVKLSCILGHSNIETTRIYTRETGRDCIRQIGRLGFVTG